MADAAGIGVDVVDLADPSIRGQHEDGRFLARVLSSAERERLEAAEPTLRGRLLWTLWAAKEAAYKSGRASGWSGPFERAAFEVRLEEPARVASPAGAFDLQFLGDAHRVHAVCWRGRGAVSTGAARLEDPPPDHRTPGGREALSEAARRLAIGELRQALQGEIAVSEPAAGAPATLLVDGRPSRIPLSLSHHGACVAYAALLG